MTPKQILKKVIPDPILYQISPIVVREYTRALSWYACGRHYDAPIDPFELITINPNEVNHFADYSVQSHFHYSDAICEVVDGDWDKECSSLEGYYLYDSLTDHFNNDKPWTETPMYRIVSERLEHGDVPIWGCQSPHELDDRLETLDQLYQSIKEYGYRYQEELRTQKISNPGHRDIHRYWPPILHEVTINIGRDGTYCLHEGRHRLIIAQCLGLSTVPVRIKTRHSLWQEKRDNEYNRGSSIQRSDHPDLTNFN